MSATPNPGPGYKQHPGHKITVEPSPSRVQVVFNGEVIADSHSALILREASYPPVYYLPAADVRREALQDSAHKTHCPFKGDASYWSIELGGKKAQDVVWSYLAPYDEVMEIKGYMAFYPNRVDKIIAD